MNFDVPDMDCYSHIWLAVLMQAVEDATVWVPDAQPLTEMHYNQRTAVNWFRATREDVGSFNWVCTTLNLDQGELLEKVRQRRAEAVRAARERGGYIEPQRPPARLVGALRWNGGQRPTRGPRILRIKHADTPRVGD